MSVFDRLYAAYAVDPNYDGPLADDFHDMIARQWLRGMRGGHTSLEPGVEQSVIVRCHLQIEWNDRHGLNQRMRGMDHPTTTDRVNHLRLKLKRALYARFKPNPYREMGS